MTISPPQSPRRALAPVVVSKTDANLALPVVQGVWTDVDPLGTANARPLDVVIPNVEAGQWVSLTPTIHPSNVAQSFQVDAWTIVAGAAVHQMGFGNSGVSAWLLPASSIVPITASRHYQLQPDDIENGAVRLRLKARNTGTTARNIVATVGFEFRLEGRGPFD